LELSKKRFFLRDGKVSSDTSPSRLDLVTEIPKNYLQVYWQAMQIMAKHLGIMTIEQIHNSCERPLWEKIVYPLWASSWRQYERLQSAKPGI